MLKRLFNLIELWLWKHHFISIGGIAYFPIGGGKSSSKSSKAEQTAAQQAQEAELKAAEEQKKAAQEAERKLIEAGKVAREQTRLAGEPTAEETERRERFKTKALTPGETLMTQAGPISQAVARRMQERIETPYEFEESEFAPLLSSRIKGRLERPIGTYEEGSLMPEVRQRIKERVVTPGLDYMTELPAFVEGVSAPLWRALKQRGIAPPAGVEAGLGGQQFMKGAIPALAELRARAISEDIARGEAFGGYEEALKAEDIERAKVYAAYQDAITQYEDAIRRGDMEAAENYATQARQLQQIYEEAESMLGEAIRARQYEAGMRGAEAEQLGTREGAPYEVTGAQAQGRGLTEAARINQEEVQARYARQREEKAAIGKMVATIVLGARAGEAMPPATSGVSAGAGAAGGGMAGLGMGGGTDTATQLALAGALQQPTVTPTTIPATPKRLPSLPQYYENQYALPSALQKRIYARG